ncbi:hypothetical protein D9M73_140940 [compost metagenome]
MRSNCRPCRSRRWAARPAPTSSICAASPRAAMATIPARSPRSAFISMSSPSPRSAAISTSISTTLRESRACRGRRARCTALRPKPARSASSPISLISRISTVAPISKAIRSARAALAARPRGWSTSRCRLRWRCASSVSTSAMRAISTMCRARCASAAAPLSMPMAIA